MHLDQDLELIWKWLRWIQKKEMEEMTKKSLKINISISHDYAKWTKMWNCAANK